MMIPVPATAPQPWISSSLAAVRQVSSRLTRVFVLQSGCILVKLFVVNEMKNADGFGKALCRHNS
jgi:hypothetical protein